MITKRQVLILVAIVEEYVKTNEPVGSVTLTKRDDLNCSSATIRNEMAILEELGYLEKTHTSSGRVPSEKGYRLYVEEVMKRQKDHEVSYPIIDEIFSRPDISSSEAISESMSLFTDLTNYASIVLGKTAINSRIKKIQLIELKYPNALIIMVTDQGHVENKRIRIPEGFKYSDIEKVIKALDEILHNVLFSDIEKVISNGEFDEKLKYYMNYHEELVYACLEIFKDMVSDKYQLSGKYNIMSQPEFQDIEKAKEFLDAIERKDIMRIVSSDRSGITIKIGQENELKFLKDCTVITVPYEASDGTIGAISVFGPTRMEYSKVISLLEYIAKYIKKVI